MSCLWAPVSFNKAAAQNPVCVCTLALGCKWQPQPGDRGGCSCLHPQILAKEQENSRTIYTHPLKPGSGGVLQSPILSSLCKCCCHKVVGGCQLSSPMCASRLCKDYNSGVCQAGFLQGASQLSPTSPVGTPRSVNASSSQIYI